MRQVTHISGSHLMTGCAVRIHLLALFIVVAASITALEQHGSLDGHTPSGAFNGLIGSDSLANFENVNYYNGSLNITLPLLQVGLSQ